MSGAIRRSGWETMNDIRKQKTTLYLDEDVLRRTAATAAGSGA